MKFGFSQLLRRLGRSLCKRDMDATDCDMEDYKDPIPKEDDQNQGAIIEEFEKSTPMDGSGSTSHSNSDPSHYENNDEDEDADASVDVSDYDYGDYDDVSMFDDEADDTDKTDYLALQAQFDNDRVPPGVEATFSRHDSAPRSRKVIVQPFERFEMVDDPFPKHHYMNEKVHKPPKQWIKRIQEEWKILNNLPDAIFVKACETRMELMQAIIVGPAGTPYHDGLFIFDIFFPPTFPEVPPKVYYHSGGLRLNPNLYENGKVCLSLLNTWTGDKNEKWIPKNSTMLQVLVSIQALILNSEPFFNEPGFSTKHLGEDGKRRSKIYSENVFVLSLKTMGYTLANPPKHFEELIKWHFKVHAHDILTACKSYIEEGTPVGAVIIGKDKDKEKVGHSGPPSREFLANLSKMMGDLVAKFINNGATDCEIFRLAQWQPPTQG